MGITLTTAISAVKTTVTGITRTTKIAMRTDTKVTKGSAKNDKEKSSKSG